MTRDAWLELHPFLQPIARFCSLVEAAASDVAGAGASAPRWDEYASDYHDGVPLLRSNLAAIDLAPAGPIVAELVARLASGSLTGQLAADVRGLCEQLRNEDARRRAVDWLLGDDGLAPASPGLLRFLGWTALSRWLVPVVSAFERWRPEESWQRSYCPTCGSPPAMAWLIGVDPGRLRFLSCPCCTTRWRFNRTACPFCDTDSQRLAVVAIEGEARLRIDHCESCRGYLKTYLGQGDEALFLADWSSLHLDLIARDRGLQRRSASLYELGSALP